MYDYQPIIIITLATIDMNVLSTFSILRRFFIEQLNDFATIVAKAYYHFI